MKNGDMLEVLDGQQRITSFGRFVKNKLDVEDVTDGRKKQFESFPKDIKEKVLNTRLTIYICEGEESEIKQWFKTINIAGIPLNEQELLNAIFSGTFVTKAREEFSNSQNSNVQMWSTYIKGSAQRQD